jgi:hypothetical protein
VRHRPWNGRGNILDERAATGNVHDLQAPADGEDRQARFDRRRDQRHLVLIPAGLRRNERFMGRLAEQLRVHVATSGEEQATDAADHTSGIVVHGVEHAKLAARALH